MPREPLSFGLEIVGSFLYACCGSRFRQLDTKVYALDLSSRNPHWVAKKSLKGTRYYVSSVQLDGRIYALGGCNGYVRLNKCYRYDPATNEWTAIAKMNHRRAYASAAVHNGRIYIAGGSNNADTLRSMEYYDKVSDKWTLVAPMTERRCDFSLVNFRGCLWAIGGRNHNEM